MTNEELTDIINRLEDASDKQTAYLAIHQPNHHPNESYIEANEEGLRLLASSIIQASLDLRNLTEEKKFVELQVDEDWMYDGDVFIEYIEPYSGKKEKEIYIQTWPDKLMPIGCVTALIILISSIIVGLYTIATWIF